MQTTTYKLVNGKVVFNQLYIYKTFESAILILSLVYVSNAFAPIIDESVFLEVLFTGSLLISLLLAVYRLSLRVNKKVLDWRILTLVLYTACSVFWSDNPTQSATRFTVLLAVIVLGAYFGHKFEASHQLDILLSVVLFTISSGFLIALLNVDIAFTEGNFTGVFADKNALGRMASLGLILAAVNIGHSRRVNPKDSIAVLLCLITLYASNSTTSLVVSIIVILLLPLILLFASIKSQNSIAVLAVTLLLLMLSAGGTILANPHEFGQFVGKVERNTLVGRMTLWNTLSDQMGERPFFGYGYDTFWREDSNTILEVWDRHGWRPKHSHNGYIDIVLDLGIIGMVILLFNIPIIFFAAFRHFQSSADKYSLWSMLFISYIVVVNFVYSVLWSNSLFYTLIYIAGATTLFKKQFE